MLPKNAFVMAGTALAVAAVTIGGATAFSFLSGGGTQPEEILPANAVAFVKIDLDPSAGQKVNVYRLSKKFERIDVTDKDSVKDALLKSMVEDAGTDGLDYEKDFKDWVGDRAAFAALPAPGTEDGITPLLAVQFTDEAKMRAGLARVEEAMDSFTPDPGPEDRADSTALDPAPATEPDDLFAYAVREDYVLISDDQGEVDAAAHATDVLADAETFRTDAGSVGDDQVMLAWADLGALYDIVPEADKEAFADTMGGAVPAGRFVVGVHAESDYLEAVGRTRDLEVEGLDEAAFLAAPGTGLASSFPADTTAAFSATNLDQVFSQVWSSYGTAFDLDQLAEDAGLDMPDDLRAVLGTETAVGGRFRVAPESFDAYVTAVTADPARAVEVIEMLDDGFNSSETDDDSYTVATSDEALAALGESPTLAEDETFRKVVADPDGAGSILFVDIATLVDQFISPDDEQYPDAQPFDALGFSSSGDYANATVTARLLFR